MLNYFCSSTQWTVNADITEFLSPSKDSEQPDQRVIFEEAIKDGSISADITPLEGKMDAAQDCPYRECHFLFRLEGDHFYMAGLGGFGSKFFIGTTGGKNNNWHVLRSIGSSRDLRAEETYRMRIKFNSNRILLYQNDAEVLSVEDSDFVKGRWGLRTNSTRARFANVKVDPVLPRCFVIMPFEPKMNGVFDLIKDVCTANRVDCIRSDERMISEPVMADVQSQIAASDLVVVDFTGRNPNVYFEAGLAAAGNKKWIILAQSEEDLTFDVKHIRAIIYENQIGGERVLSEKLAAAFRATLEETESK
jgi:hypothetical protein